jgi:long-chain acyl-CoA synthetase
VAIAASKEFFTGRRLSYYLASLFFHVFPLPQREAGAIDALRHAGKLIGEGWCVLIFPEGQRSDAGEIRSFQPGVGMMASKLGVPVVPVRLEGLDRILHKGWHMARRGRASVKFGAPLRVDGDDYQALARQVEAAVRDLGPG